MLRGTTAFISIAMLAILLSSCKKEPQAAPKNGIPAVSQAEPENKPKSKLDEIFTTEMLSSDLPSLEKLAGKPKDKFGNTREYKVGKCPLTVYTDGKSISSIEMKVSPSCTFDISNIAPNLPKNTYAHTLTHGQFDAITNGGGQFMADCLGMCGNAADPSVYHYWQAPRSDQFVEFMLETQLVTDKASNAASKWENIMRKKEGEDFVMYTKFNCGKYDRDAHRLFKNVPITHIRVGSGISDDVKKNFTAQCK
ncbi:hypothetical protein [uncultured Oxalobacter sp.]|uniref:hypothetical protein n=1 Tax=uncultured Oxalobacter sp. TaxID=337245 RepID=UPI00259A7747|nr:hypothetical protein [uncultured Oxalobacter sp.]